MVRVVLAACLVPIGVFYFLHGTTLTSENFDGFVAIFLARSLLDNASYAVFGQPHNFFPPSYPVFLAFFMVLIENELFAAQVGNLVLWIFNILILTKLCLRFTGSKSLTALTLLFYVFSNRIQMFSLILYSENLLTTLYLLITYFLLDCVYTKLNIKKITWLIFLCLIAFYCKPEAFLSVAALMGYLFYVYKKRFVKYFLYGSMIYLIGIAPWVLWTYSITGEVSISGKSNAIIAFANKIHHEEPTTGLFAFPSPQQAGSLGDMFTYLSTMPSQPFSPTVRGVTKNLFENSLEYLYKYLGLLLPIFLLSFWFCPSHWREPIVVYPMLLFGLSFFCMSLLYSSPRFWLPFVPFFYIYCAREVLRWRTWLHSRYPAIAKPIYTSVLVLAVLLQFPMGWILNKEFIQYPVLNTNWHERLALPTAARLATNHVSLIYALPNARFTMLPVTSSAAELHQFCRNNHIDYLLMYRWWPKRQDALFPPNLAQSKFFINKFHIPIDSIKSEFVLALKPK